MLSKNKTLNLIFTIELILFGLIITGVLPRETAIFLAVGLAIYVAMAPIEDATVFFVRSIPLFIALPITANYDNLNTWRILSIILFLKLAHITGLKYFLNIKEFSKPVKLLVILAVLAVFSIVPAVDKSAAITRIIFFVNFSLVGVVVYYLVQRDYIGNNMEVELPYGSSTSIFRQRLVRNIAIPTIIVTVVGFIQVASTYFIDIYQFMRLWGEGIQMRQFGVLWSEIAVRLGNTWFAYYGDQLSLRVFSLFPDSHSFPQFVLLGLPAMFAVALQLIIQKPGFWRIPEARLLDMIKTRANLSVLWIPAAFLITILSGTRGIWAASVGVILVILLVLYWLNPVRSLARTKGASPQDLPGEGSSRGTSAGIASGETTSFGMKKEVEPRDEVQPRKDLFKYISLYMLVFYLLFAVAYPIFVSPQFLLSKGDWGLFGNRIRSIIDFGETSNSQRIEIWKASLESIKKHPLLGVGIGNFPIVLDQRIFLARAGSSAHNIYLHIAAEMGILALVTAIWFLWLVFKKSYENFVSEKDPLLITYFGASLIFVPWVLIYSLTDVALFDERAFLLFITTISLILANKKLGNAEN